MSDDPIEPLRRRADETGAAFMEAIAALMLGLAELPSDLTPEERAGHVRRLHQICIGIRDLTDEIFLEVAATVTPHGDA